MKPTLFPAPSEEKSGPRRPGLSFKSDNSFFGASEGKISGVFVFNYRPFPLVRPVIRITFTLSMHRLIPLMINMVVVTGVLCRVHTGETTNDPLPRKSG